MQLDPAKYRHHLDGFDMDDAEKLAFMEQLWGIMESFVTRAFHEEADTILLGINPVGHTHPADDGLGSETIISEIFNDAVGETMAGKNRS